MNSERDDTPRAWDMLHLLPPLRDDDLPPADADVSSALDAVLWEAMSRSCAPAAGAGCDDATGALDLDKAVAAAARGLAKRRAARGDYTGTLWFEEIAASAAEPRDRSHVSSNPLTGFLSDLCDLNQPPPEDGCDGVSACRSRRPLDRE